MKSLGRRGGVSFCAVLAVGSLTTFLPLHCQAELEFSTWESLPSETVAAMRIPEGQVIADAVMDSKFGAVMFSEERKAAVLKVREERGGEGWSKFQGELERYELKLEDLPKLLVGESGYAVLMNAENADADNAPVFSGVGWLAPGDSLAAKLYGIVGQMIEEQEDAEHPVTRVDLTLADQQVMQLRVPSIRVEYDDDAYDLGDDYDDLSEEEQEIAWEEATKRWEESAVETVNYRTVLVSQFGGRLLVAHSFQASSDEEVAGAAEALGEMFGRLIAAHTSGDGEFVAKLANDPGVTRVMGQEGVSSFELLGDVSPFVELLQSEVVDSENSQLAVRLLGLAGLGPIAGRSTIDGAQSNTYFSVAIPAPRQGLMRLLDQELLAIDPPAWVPASAVRYYQMSFDLGKAYEIIKEEVLREFPDKAASGFNLAESYTQGFAQASLPEVLSSLGNRHTLISFGYDASERAAALSTGKKSVKLRAGIGPVERMALVWQVDDEELWARLLKGMTPFAKMSEGLEFSEEQGFSGWRMSKGKAEGGLFLGKGYLVLAIGNGVLESMLSSLNNPPVGEDSLQGSEVYAKAGELIDLEPATLAEITDGDRYMSMAVATMRKQFEQVAALVDRGGDDEEETSLMLELIKAVVPSEEEMKGMMGTIVSRWETNDDGIFVESAQEMP